MRLKDYYKQRKALFKQWKAQIITKSVYFNELRKLDIVYLRDKRMGGIRKEGNKWVLAI